MRDKRRGSSELGTGGVGDEEGATSKNRKSVTWGIGY